MANAFVSDHSCVLDLDEVRLTISPMNPPEQFLAFTADSQDRRGIKPFMKTNLLSPSKIVLAGLCAALMSAIAFGQSTFPSQPYTWKNVTVKGGGFICDVVFNTTQPNLVYCRTDIGSSYKWDNQAKKWIPLTDWCGIGNLHGSESIATDPIDPQH